MRVRLAAALVLAVAAAAADAPPPRGPFRKIAVIALKEASGEAIDPSVKSSVLRRLREAEAQGADCVVFDIESYGGMVDSSIETGDEIFDLGARIHTIAYVSRRAISGAAMISLACREIVMSEAGSIGDSQAILMTADGFEVAPEKTQSVVAQTFRKYAKRNGYPIPLAEGMVRQEMEVVRYRKPVDPADPSRGHVWVYFRSDDGDELPTERERQEQGLTDRELVSRAGELVMIHAREALDRGFCSRLEPNLDTLLASIRAPDGVVVTLDWNWAENASRWLISVRSLLFIVGLGSLYFALKTPGTGIPEALALISFGLFFGASALAGFAGSLELILFFAGVLLIVLEIFVIPGFGVTGLAGLACVLVSFALAALPEGDSPYSPGHYLFPMARDFFFGVVGAGVIGFFVAKHLPKVPLFRGLTLAAAPAAGSLTGSGTATARDREHPLLGATGVTETALRPAGKATLAGRRVDVVTEGGFLDEGTPVQVVAVRGNVVVVRKVGG
ncbi:MAG: NfeD family protein [Planctomycetaceae bacterium]